MLSGGAIPPSSTTVISSSSSSDDDIVWQDVQICTPGTASACNHSIQPHSDVLVVSDAADDGDGDDSDLKAAMDLSMGIVPEFLTECQTGYQHGQHAPHQMCNSSEYMKQFSDSSSLAHASVTGCLLDPPTDFSQHPLVPPSVLPTVSLSLNPGAECDAAVAPLAAATSTAAPAGSAVFAHVQTLIESSSDDDVVWEQVHIATSLPNSEVTSREVLAPAAASDDANIESALVDREISQNAIKGADPAAGTGSAAAAAAAAGGQTVAAEVRHPASHVCDSECPSPAQLKLASERAG